MAKEKSLNIIGIDSSTSCTGISYIHIIDKKEVLVDYAKFSSNKKDVIERYIETYSFILTFYDKYSAVKPTVCIELLNSRRNMHTTRILAGLWGYIVASLLKDRGIKIIGINTSEAKKSLTGDGTADKYKIVKQINKLFKLELLYNEDNKDKSDDDIADAISIALAFNRIYSKGAKIAK